MTDQDLFEQLLSKLPDAVILLDDSQKVTYANLTAINLIGNGDADRFIGKTFGQPIVHGETTQIQLLTPEGLKHGEMRVSQIRLFDSSHTLVIIRDISDLIAIRDQYRDILLSTIETLSTTSEVHDPYTAGHEHRVACLSYAIAKKMGYDMQFCEGLYVAGLLHDIGKLAIPAEILTKPSTLKPQEYELIKTHARVGYDILKRVELPWPVAETIYQHHERCDGSGYPRGLSSNEILEQAKVMAVADSCEAMMNSRPYRQGLGQAYALKIIMEESGVRLDADACRTCVELFEKKLFSFDDPAPLLTATQFS